MNTRAQPAGPRGRRRPAAGAEDFYPAPLPVAFPLFLAFIAFSYLQAGIRFPILSAIRAEFILGMLLAVLSFVAIGQRGKDFQWTAVGKWGLALVLVLGLMTIMSIDWTVSSDVFVDRVFKFALIGLFISAFVTSPHRLKLFLLVYLLVMAKLGQEGLFGTITGSMIWENQGIPRLHGSTPSYMHPNSFSGVAVSALPFIAFVFPLVSRKWQIVLVVLMLLMLNIVLRTGSRTGYVALFVALIWFAMHAQHRVRVIAGMIVVGVILSPFIPDDYVGRATSIFDEAEVGEDSSTGQRKEILVDAWEVFTRRPLGVGVGAFPVIRQQWFGRVQDTHNLYLEVATNAGIQGLVVFGVFIYLTFRYLRRTHQSATMALESLGWSRWDSSYNAEISGVTRNHISDLLWIRAAASAFIGFIVVRLALGLFGMDLYERYWWFAGGGTIALWNLARLAEQKSHYMLKLAASGQAPSEKNSQAQQSAISTAEVPNAKRKALTGLRGTKAQT